MMTLANLGLLLGYASLLLELVVFAVPSVASTWQHMQGRPSRRWALLHLLPTVAAVAAFAWPGALALWRAAAPTTTEAFPQLAGAALAIACTVAGRALTLTAVAALRAPRSGTFTTAGPYRLSRNPALVGLHVFLAGGVAAFPAWHTALAWLWFVAHMHRRVRTEERHLLAQAGAEYAEYCRQVPRYAGLDCRRQPD